MYNVTQKADLNIPHCLLNLKSRKPRRYIYWKAFHSKRSYIMHGLLSESAVPFSFHSRHGFTVNFQCQSIRLPHSFIRTLSESWTAMASVQSQTTFETDRHGSRGSWNLKTTLAVVTAHSPWIAKLTVCTHRRESCCVVHAGITCIGESKLASCGVHVHPTQGQWSIAHHQ